MLRLSLRAVCFAAMPLILLAGAGDGMAGNYKNFNVAVYIPVGIVKRFAEPDALETQWNAISAQLKVDKVYIETSRRRDVADEKLIEQVKQFFVSKGVKVAGGLTLDAGGDGQFQSLCYTDPKDRDFVSTVTAFTAKLFDEIILDDFFFVSTKTDSDIEAKGARTWTQFRLELMREVAENLVLKPARKANPKVRVIIKYPNWYEHFQGLGFDLDKEAKMFDGIYAGTETRDPVVTDQNLQQYESYQIVRYFENIKPGGNGGGWVDTFNVRYLDRYAEQLWDTMFAKPREITLFNWRNLQDPASAGDRAAWEHLPTSLDYQRLLRARTSQTSTTPPQLNMGGVAGYSLEQVDKFLGQLGNPIGIAAYKPYQSSGEDFLHNYFGNMGIPINLTPDFPTTADLVLLTESAKYDPEIVTKIKGQLKEGRRVVITSGLLRALQGKGIEDVVELECTDRKAEVRDFLFGYGPGAGRDLGNAGTTPILFPQIRFFTNDTWPMLRGIANGRGYPILLMNRYSRGVLYVWTIPDNPNDLYSMPAEALNVIRRFVMGDFFVRLEGPGQIALFAYDNNTLIVQSYLHTETDVKLALGGGFTKVRDLLTDKVTTGTLEPRMRGGRTPERNLVSLRLLPHSYMVFAAEK